MKKRDTSMLTMREKSNMICATSGSAKTIYGNRQVLSAACRVSFEIRTLKSRRRREEMKRNKKGS